MSISKNVRRKIVLKRLITGTWICLLVVALVYLVLFSSYLTWIGYHTFQTKDSVYTTRVEFAITGSIQGVENNLDIIRDDLQIYDRYVPISVVVNSASLSTNFIPFVSMELLSVSSILESLEAQVFSAESIIGLYFSEKGTMEQIFVSVKDKNPNIPLIKKFLISTEILYTDLSLIESISDDLLINASNGSLTSYMVTKYSSLGELQKDIQKYTKDVRELVLIYEEITSLAIDEYLKLSEAGHSIDWSSPENDLYELNRNIKEFSTRANYIDTRIYNFNTNLDRAGGLEEFSKFATVFHRLNIAIIELLELGTSGFDKQENDVISQELIWLEQALKRLRDLSPEIQENISVLNHRFGIFVDSTIPLVNTNVRQELSPEVQLIEKWLLELTKATDLLDISGDLLGIEDTNHILLLGHSSDELRGTGGFVSGIWIVDINGLERYEVTYFDVVKVDDMKKIEDYPSPPKLLEEHMGAWVFLMRDVSWSPDFREVAEASRTMINISQGIETDFVVGFNQQTLIDVLSEIDLHVNDEKQIKIDSKDLIQHLERGTDSEGRSYMNYVLVNILKGLKSPESLKGLLALYSSISKSLDSHDIMIYTNEPYVDDILVARGWDGGLFHMNESTNFLYVLDSNVGWSKSDRNIERNTNVSVSFKSITDADIKFELEYVNHSGYSAAPCEPQWIDRGETYGQLLNSCYWNLFRILVPEGNIKGENSYLPLPSRSVSVASGAGLAGSNTLKVDSVTDAIMELSGLVVVGPGEKQNITINYYVDVLNSYEYGNCVAYDILMRKQPGVPNRKYSIEFSPPDSYHVDNILVKSRNSDESRVDGMVVSGVLKSDHKLSLVLRNKKLDEC